MIVNLPQVLTALCVPILTGTWAAIWRMYRRYQSCLLYTSDAADDQEVV